MKVVFFGSPDFAVAPLLALVRAGDMTVSLVVSRPDRKAGRGGRLRSPPVVNEARGLKTPVLQPEAVKGNRELLERLERESADAFVVAAYGRILPPEILNLPRLGCLNVHASLLPRYRGASPIAAALMAGDSETGISIMQMTEGLDEGPVLAEQRVAIGPDEDAGALSKRLSEIGAKLLVATLRRRQNGEASPRPQDGEPSYCRPLTRADGRIDWSRTAGEISRRRRAFSPWPGVFTFVAGERLKILDAAAAPGIPGAEPGELGSDGSGQPLVACGGETSLRLRTVQREGRRAVSGEEFLRGLAPGAIRLG